MQHPYYHRISNPACIALIFVLLPLCLFLLFVTPMLCSFFWSFLMETEWFIKAIMLFCGVVGISILWLLPVLLVQLFRKAIRLTFFTIMLIMLCCIEIWMVAHAKMKVPLSWQFMDTVGIHSTHQI